MTELRPVLTTDEITIIADRAVKATLISLGFDIATSQDLRAHQDDFRYLRNQRLGSEEFGRYAKRAFITATVGGLLFALWQGIRIAFTMKGIGQ